MPPTSLMAAAIKEVSRGPSLHMDVPSCRALVAHGRVSHDVCMQASGCCEMGSQNFGPYLIGHLSINAVSEGQLRVVRALPRGRALQACTTTQSDSTLGKFCSCNIGSMVLVLCMRDCHATAHEALHCRNRHKCLCRQCRQVALVGKRKVRGLFAGRGDASGLLTLGAAQPGSCSGQVGSSAIAERRERRSVASVRTRRRCVAWW
jgi:hypothetical protein